MEHESPRSSEPQITRRTSVFTAARVFAHIRKSVTARVLITALVLVSALTALATAQTNRNPYDLYGPYNSGVFTLDDKHFRGLLFPNVYERMPSVKIAWPGLYISEESSGAVGLLPDRLTAGAGWNGVYGWVDVNNRPGKMGLWLGNFNMESGYRVSVYHQDNMAFFWDTRDFELRGAFWGSPFKNDVLKGISVTFDVFNKYAFNGDEFVGLTNILGYYVNINTLTKIGDKYMLRAGLRTYNRQSEAPEDSRFANRQYYRDGLHIGLVDDKLRTLEMWGENTYAVNNADERYDTLSAGLRFTQGWAARHKKHRLFYGIRAETSASFKSNIDQDAGSFQYGHYIANATFEGRIFRVNLISPLVLDVRLHRNVRCMLSIAPAISYFHIAELYGVDHLPFPPEQSALYLNPQHSFAVGMMGTELTLTGPVGDRFDFTIRPTISNDVFISAMELRYRF